MSRKPKDPDAGKSMADVQQEMANEMNAAAPQPGLPQPEDARAVERAEALKHLPAIVPKIEEFKTVAATIVDMRHLFYKRVYDLESKAGFAEARRDRAKLRELRTGFADIKTARKEKALEECRLIDSEARIIVAAIEELEDPIADQIKAEEQAIEARKQAAIDAEAARVNKIRASINSILRKPQLLVGMTSAMIAERIQSFAASEVTAEEFAEWFSEAVQAKTDSLDAMRRTLDVRISEERAEKQRQDERQELDRRREDDRQREERESEKRKAEQVESDRRYVQDSIIAAFRNIPLEYIGASSSSIEEQLARMDDRGPDPVVFGDRMGEANKAYVQARSTLQSMLTAARQREASEAQLAEERRLREASEQREREAQAQRDAEVRAGQERLAAIKRQEDQVAAEKQREEEEATRAAKVLADKEEAEQRLEEQRKREAGQREALFNSTAARIAQELRDEHPKSIVAGGLQLLVDLCEKNQSTDIDEVLFSVRVIVAAIARAMNMEWE